MKDIETYLKQAARGVALSEQERERMREAIHRYMDMMPLSQSGAPRFVISSFFFSTRSLAFSLIAALFISSAGISYAAEGALPGDALYGVKTNINEPIQGALALTQSAKTAWAMSIAGERVEEATTLAAEGRLDQETQRSLQANFETHAAIAENSIQAEASSSPEAGAEAATSFEAQLSEYQHVLTQVGSATHVEVGAFAASVGTQSVRIAQIRSRAERAVTATSTTALAASQAQVEAQADIDASVKLATQDSSAFSSSSAEGISAQLTGADAVMSEGENLLKQHSAPEALSAFQNALATSEQLGVYLRTSSAIHARTGLVIGEPERTTARGTSTRAEATVSAPVAEPIEGAATSSASIETTVATSSTASDQIHSTEGASEGAQVQTGILPVSLPILP